MIEVEGLAKHYGDFAAVTELSFAVQPGQLLGLVGPNGAGKTSTLRCLAGVIPATHGSIRLCGYDLTTAPVDAKRHLAFFPDEPRLFEYLTVRQHLEFSARLFQVDDAHNHIPGLLDELELTDKAGRLPAELSRGMKQKVALACGLLHRPRVVLFDEPLTGLDPLAIRRMKDTIVRLGLGGAAIVISSHLLHLLEELCTHVLVLKQGRAVAHGTLADVRQRFAGNSEASLEEVFLRIASGDGAPIAPPVIPPTPANPGQPPATP